MCFDKTGTLTQNAMELHSIVKFDKGKQTIIKNSHEKSLDEKLLEDDIITKLMASCHTVRKVGEKFLGDELDLRMFLFSEYQYEVPQDDQSVKLNLIFEN